MQRYLVFTKKSEINPDRVHYGWLVLLYTSKRVTAIVPVLSETIIKESHIYSYLSCAATYSYSSYGSSTSLGVSLEWLLLLRLSRFSVKWKASVFR